MVGATLSLPGKSLLSRGMPSRLPMGRLERMDRMQWLSQIRCKEACSPLGRFISYAFENMIWGKQMHSWVQALLVAATYPYGSAANSLSQSHTFSILVFIDYYAYSCLLCSLAPPSLQLACLPGNKHAPKGSDRKLRW